MPLLMRRMNVAAGLYTYFVGVIPHRLSTT
jgi:hypothetical protein